MARKAFYSFHYNPDNWRASQVRNMGVIEGNSPVSDNDWEEVTEGGETAIKKWIDDQMSGRSCVVVLIGAGTAGRKWINYEIKTGWNNGKGLVGIYIHNLKDHAGDTSSKGSNPFAGFTMEKDKVQLSSVVKTYNPTGSTSKEVYESICNNLATWVEEAIQIRNNY